MVPFRKETRSGSGFGEEGWRSGRSSDTKRTSGRTSKPRKRASNARSHEVMHMRLIWMHRDLVPSVGVPELAAGDTSWTRSSSSEVHAFHIVHDVAVAKRIVGSPSFLMLRNTFHETQQRLHVPSNSENTASCRRYPGFGRTTTSHLHRRSSTSRTTCRTNVAPIAAVRLALLPSTFV